MTQNRGAFIKHSGARKEALRSGGAMLKGLAHGMPASLMLWYGLYLLAVALLR
jgi:hypothetical protein